MLMSFADRLCTFQNWANPFVQPRALARAGFVFLDEKDIVECIFCHIRLDEWKMKDIPLFEHYRFSPFCPLTLGEMPEDEASFDSQTTSRCVDSCLGHDVVG
uniref:Uncharacterized protein n=1 Tax=Strigamia maritima TaxID=126957 RepID=T1JPI6_STRMM